MNRMLAVFSLVLSLLFTVLQEGPTKAEDKWLIYAMPDMNWQSAVYLGYVEEPGQQLTPLTPLYVFQNLKTDRARIDEKDNVSIIAYVDEGQPALLCKLTKTAYVQPPDSKIPPPIKLAGAQGVAQPLVGDQNVLWGLIITKIKYAVLPGYMLVFEKIARGQIHHHVCSLNVIEQGGFKIEYQLIEKQAANEVVKLKDEVQVHSMYRFRVMAGPVYSSLKKKDRAFNSVNNSLGQTYISSTIRSDQPVNFPLMLKLYLPPEGRDLLEDLPIENTFVGCRQNPFSREFWNKCNLVKRISPVVGIDLIENPLQNLYLGASFEFYQGVDLVAGIHWAKVTKLTSGFTENQILPPGTTFSTERRFETGWFVGMQVDVGIIGTWLKSTFKQVIS